MLQGEIPERAVYVSLEIHPWRLTAENILLQIERMEESLSDQRVLALGETGLDKITACPFSLQMEAFENVVEMSELYSKPLIIHCVKSVDELIAAKKRMCPTEPWIIHGFRGKLQQAESLLRHGFFLSLGEYYHAQVAQEIPIERLFLETDESKVPIDELYDRVAILRGVSSEELKLAVEHNICNVFHVNSK